MTPEEKKLKRENALADLKHVLSSKQGRRFVWDLLDTSKVFHTTFTGNSYTYFNEGRRAVGLEIYKKVVQQNELYLKMVEENCEFDKETS